MSRSKKNRDPDKTVHLQVVPGATAVYQRHAYGDRSTLQVPGRDVEALLEAGGVVEIDPSEVPDVAEVSSP